jgi:putative MFS transporter
MSWSESPKKTADALTVRRLRVASGLSVGIDGYNLTVIGAVLLWTAKSLHLSSDASTLLAAMALVGALIGGLVAGWLTDRLGRRLLFTYDLLVFIVFGMVSALAPSLSILLVSRLVLGAAIGADYAIGPAYLSEMAEAEDRGYQLGFMWAFWSFGAVFAYLMAGGFVGLVPEALAWRILLGLPVLPAIYALVLRQRLPESPRWLTSQPARREREPHSVASDRPGVKVLSWAGRQEQVRRWLLITLPWFLFDFAAYGLALMLPSVLKESGMTGVRTSLWGSATIVAFGLIGSVVGMLLVDKIGRKAMQAWGLTLAGVLLFVWVARPHWGGFTWFIVVVAAGNLVIQFGGLVTGIYPAEVFPTRNRALALGVGNAVSRVGAVVGVVVLGLAQTRFGLVGPVALAAGAAVLAGLSTAVLGIDTHKRSLEELNAVPTALPLEH